MYESVASDISFINIGAHSFEINCLYTTTFDRIYQKYHPKRLIQFVQFSVGSILCKIIHFSNIV